MIWMSGWWADRKVIESALRRCYPTGVLDEVDVNALDQDLPIARLVDLLEDVAAVPRLTAVLEPEIVRSHILHVGIGGLPDWEELNREFTDQERQSAVAASKDGILYWNIRISRIGPCWSEHWTLFESRHGTVVAEPANSGHGNNWTSITDRVRNTLVGYGLRGVNERQLRAPVSWLSASRGVSNLPQSTVPPTVYDALFSEVY